MCANHRHYSCMYMCITVPTCIYMYICSEFLLWLQMDNEACKIIARIAIWHAFYGNLCGSYSPSYLRHHNVTGQCVSLIFIIELQYKSVLFHPDVHVQCVSWSIYFGIYEYSLNIHTVLLNHSIPFIFFKPRW